MNRILLLFALMVPASSHVAAQDMSLSQILIDGKGWQTPQPGSGSSFGIQMLKTEIPGIESPSCNVYSLDCGTLYVGSKVGHYIWAFRVEKDNSLTAGQPYCALRLPSGQKNIAVTAMEKDSEGRIYAATSIGVQIFDPTERLCGVMDNPPEQVKELHFVDDRLVAFTRGSNVYIRFMKAKRAR